MTIELGILLGVLGAVLGYLGHQRTVRLDIKKDTSDHIELKTKLDHIIMGVDDIRIDQKSLDNTVRNMQGDIIRLDESVKSAHKRIDGIAEQVKE